MKIFKKIKLRINIIISDWKFKRERCAYCGWYLRPQLIFKNIKRPCRFTYGKIGEDFVCNHCYELNKLMNG